jgi:uncharacterized phiE125 gp8 family phage protein
MGLKMITAPQIEPVSMQEILTHSRIDSEEEYIYAAELITAAREYCEALQNRAYMTQTWELTLDKFSPVIVLPKPPLQSVTFIKYKDAQGIEKILPETEYAVDNTSFQGRIVPVKGWPSFSPYPVNAVTVRFVCGSNTVSERVKHAIKLLAAHWYENREAYGTMDKEIGVSVSRLLGLDRVIPI